MKHFASFSRLGAVLTLAVAGASALAIAQHRPPVAPPPAQAAAAGVSIKDITNFNKMTAPAPDYGGRANIPSVSRGRARDWGVIDATYTTKSARGAAPWTDTVTAVFHVMLENTKPEPDEKPFSYFTMTVRYANVPDGDHRAGVVLPPSYLERYGGIAAVAVEITAEGAADPAMKSELNTRNLPADVKNDWWKNDRIMKNPDPKWDRVVKRDGLIERSKSPFAFINMDDYEVVR